LAVRLLGRHDAPQSQAIAVTRAIVDSGADYTVLSTDWADLLGIELDRDCMKMRPRVALGTPHAGEPERFHYAYTDGLWVEVLGEKLLLDTVLFCADLAQTFLGRRDFFRHYLVAFDQRNLRFFLERLPDRDEDDDPDAVLVAN
jgi:hypothetical protein